MSARVVVVYGSGGAGKTTTSSAIAVAAALAGHKTLLVSVDPARRLGDVVEQRLGPLVEASDSVPGLSLWMPDASAELRRIAEESLPPASLDAFLSNPVTKTFEQSPAGLHEALVVLSLARAAREFDVVVIDTPPREQAMSFFETPRRLQQLLGGRAVSLFSRFGSGGRGLGQAALERVLGHLIPPEVISDGAEFFRLLLSARQDLEARARSTGELLERAEHVVVVSPSEASIHGATLLRKSLAQGGANVHAVLNSAVREYEGANPARYASDAAKRFPGGWHFPRIEGSSRTVVEGLAAQVPLFA